MTNEVEPAKKILLPYLQRADELQKHEPLVAYYCRLYAMERGLKIPVKERTKTTSAILVSLMKQLEKDKKSIQLSPEDNLYVEGFALNVFGKADKQDRAGRADLNTAKTFYAASIFIEILHQFGPLQPDIEQKQKYAVWKAADIRKALSEGRKPVPGPPGGEEDVSTSHESMDLEGSPHNTSTIRLQGKSSMQHELTEGFKESSVDGASRMDPSPPAQQHPYQHANQYATMPDGRIGQHHPPVPYVPAHAPLYIAASQHGFKDGYHGSSDGRHHGAPPYQEYPHMVASPPGPLDGFNGHHGSSTDGHHHGAALYQESSQVSASQHGSTDGIHGHHGPTDGNHGSPLYQEYPQATAGVPVYVGGPTRDVGNNGAYYQLQGHAMSYPTASPVAYPASAPFSSPAGYGSFAGSSDPSGLDRTTSAPPSSVPVRNYQPTPEKVADAQKAARFAVSALAFDDVPTAIAYLKQSLDFLTNPDST